MPFACFAILRSPGLSCYWPVFALFEIGIWNWVPPNSSPLFSGRSFLLELAYLNLLVLAARLARRFVRLLGISCGSALNLLSPVWFAFLLRLLIGCSPIMQEGQSHSPCSVPDLVLACSLSRKYRYRSSWSWAKGLGLSLVSSLYICYNFDVTRVEPPLRCLWVLSYLCPYKLTIGLGHF